MAFSSQQLHYRIIGQQAGNFDQSAQSSNALFDYVKQAQEKNLLPNISYIFAPRMVGTTDIIHLDRATDAQKIRFKHLFIPTAKTPNGGLVQGCGTAIALFNNDNPMLCLYQGLKLALVNISYPCLLPIDDKKNGIISHSMLHFEPSLVKAYIFGGIGPCCWVPNYNNFPEILHPEQSVHSELKKYITKTIIRSPLGPNRVTVDLYALAHYLLRQSGIRENNISWHSNCTCCATENGQPTYWSHTRFKAGKQSIDGYNMCLAWLGQPDQITNPAMQTLDLESQDVLP